MAYNLIVEKYGKIEKAEVKISPLTLFVGDNNSGKSYLLSLIWAILSGEQDNTIFSSMQKVLQRKHSDIYNKLVDFAKESAVSEANNNTMIISGQDAVEIINSMFEENKDDLVKSIFNYDGMQIGRIAIETDETRMFVLCKKEIEDSRTLIEVKENNEKRIMGFEFPKNRDIVRVVSAKILREIVEMILRGDIRENETYYLPAARTGFMLAKNTINQVGRKKTFDIVEIKQSDIEPQVTPFPKTIIHFLDCMDNLNTHRKTQKYDELVKWIIENMSKGDVECVDENSGNVQYIPEGMKQGIPLRATSGVVTELTPLLLLLKYSKQMGCLCYEEPEMCLHPQLQLQMAKLMVRMVNKGIRVVATTHSDIIIQHINNICQLKTVEKNELIEKAGLKWQDLMDINNVSVYQFEDKGEITVVKSIEPRENVFEVDSFITALRKILEQSIDVTNIINGEEE